MGSSLIGGYDKRNINVIFDRNYGLKEMIQTRRWQGDPQQLYAFDEQTAFTCEGGPGWNPAGKIWNYWPRITQVFSPSSDGILVLEDVYALARSRFGLRRDQLFLGMIGTNIFYWETRDPRRIYFRSLGEKDASKYFLLPRAVIDIFGVTNGVTKKHKDFAFMVFRESGGLIPYAPYGFNIVEMSFNDAKKVRINP